MGKITGFLLMFAGTVFANGGDTQTGLNLAQVEYVKAEEGSEGIWRFDVTVRHNDEGWDHYADAWQVIDPQSGEILGERILAHPHDTEQPFTRSLSGIAIPSALTVVLVRAKCNVHGFGGREILVDLSQSEGDGYQIQHRR
jgi:hypothetical protein